MKFLKFQQNYGVRLLIKSQIRYMKESQVIRVILILELHILQKLGAQKEGLSVLL